MTSSTTAPSEYLSPDLQNLDILFNFGANGLESTTPSITVDQDHAFRHAKELVSSNFSRLILKKIKFTFQTTKFRQKALKQSV